MAMTDRIDILLRDPVNWYPVRTGALGTGEWAWLCRVYRNRCCGVTIYQPLDVLEDRR
jgi:hypothetical protein